MDDIYYVVEHNKSTHLSVIDDTARITLVIHIFIHLRTGTSTISMVIIYVAFIRSLSKNSTFFINWINIDLLCSQHYYSFAYYFFFLFISSEVTARSWILEQVIDTSLFDCIYLFIKVFNKIKWYF